MKTVIITQARIGSSRLPGKVLLRAAGKTFLQIHAERVSRTRLADEVIIATSVNEKDDLIAGEAAKLNIKCYRGSEEDVLERYYKAAKKANADIVVRVTSDCPFADPELMDEMILFFLENDYDYIANILEYTYPDGIDIEIMTFTSLEKAFNNAKLTSEREHVTPYIRKNSDLCGGNLFKAYNFANPQRLQEITRLTLDEPADLQVLTQLIETLGTERPWQVYYDHLLKNPQLNKLNNYISPNEGYDKSVKQDGTHN